MDQPPRSGLFKAGTIVLLVGAILQAVGALFALLFGAVLVRVLKAVAEKAGRPAPPDFLAPLLVGIAVVAAVGAVFSFVAYGRAHRGDPKGAFVFGLVGALLPPLHAVVLTGAILCKVSPEGEGRPPVQPPWPPAPPQPTSPPGWQKP